MSELVIRVHELGKRYRIGLREVRYPTLRESISAWAQAPVRAVSRRLDRSNGHNQSGDDSPNHIWALRDVSFEVQEGEVVGVIGRNGAGKSTLLKILTRITRPTTGWVRVVGRVGSLLEVGTGFHPELTGRENVYLNGAILGMTKVEIDRKFDEIVAFAEIEKFMDTPVKRYSSGMYVRLAFAVAAHLEPEILLIDEVLAVGDQEFQRKCLGKLNSVARSGRTVLFVSHNLLAVKMLCDSAILFENGALVAQGETEEVVQRYLSTGAQAETSIQYAEDLSKSGQITRLALSDSSGDPTGDFDVAASIHLTVDYCAREPLYTPRVLVTISRDDGLEIIHTASSDSGKVIGQLSPGQYQAQLTLPGRLLAPGSYRVSAQVVDRKRKVHDELNYALGFKIQGAPYPGSFRKRRGLLIYPFEWNMSGQEEVR